MAAAMLGASRSGSEDSLGVLVPEEAFNKVSRGVLGVFESRHVCCLATHEVLSPAAWCGARRWSCRGVLHGSERGMCLMRHLLECSKGSRSLM